MKERYAIVVAIMLLVALAGGPPVARALSTPLGELKDVQVTCGSTATAIRPIGASSMLIYNPSATCVRIGGSSTVSTTRGLPVGDGCDGGKTFPLDGRATFCVAESSTVVVTVLYGSN